MGSFDFLIHGMGMFAESYVLFAIGNLGGEAWTGRGGVCGEAQSGPCWPICCWVAVLVVFTVPAGPNIVAGVFKATYPTCWNTGEDCSFALTQSVTYTQVGGVMFGMVVIGFLADHLGRRWGSITTSLIMLIGSVLMTARWVTKYM